VLYGDEEGSPILSQHVIAANPQDGQGKGGRNDVAPHDVFDDGAFIDLVDIKDIAAI
jgi:hypothetical protein